MTNRVAHSKTSDFSLGQNNEFIAEFGRQGGNPDLLQALIENKARMVRVVAIARGDETPKGYALATLILGDDFISHEDVANAYGFHYSDEQVEAFTDTLPDEKTLQWLRSNGYMLVATPTTDTNLLQVRDLDNQLFYSKSEGWYTESQHTFSREDVVKAGQWLMVRKEPYPNSCSKNWGEQQKLLTEVEYVPNAPEVAYAVTAYYKVRGVYLLKGVYVRTSSVDAVGGHVDVGGFDEDGLRVGSCWRGCRFGCFGVSSARK
ncbi:hypothetical protein HQ403_00045 [Candidatus Kaiserbacteria bacterium]|nr:hypothetical protein [Candidatus Kaiserbacteria bacterium]